MSSDTFDASTRFFKSFVAGDFPLRPVDEVNADQIGDLVSFYTAAYDEIGRLVQFRKFLNTEDAEGTKHQLVFTEGYEYRENGALRCRTLLRADGGECRWVFEGDAASTKLSSCHERLLKTEDAVFRDVQKSDLKGRELSRKMWEGGFCDDATQILRDATNDSKLALEWFILDEDNTWQQSERSGFPDHPFLDFSFDAIEPLVLTRDDPLLVSSPQDLSRMLPDGKKAFEESGIRAMAAMRIRMRILGRDEPVAMLAVLAHREWSDGDQQCIGAILRRVALFFEILLELGRREDQVEEGDLLPEPNEDEQTGEVGKDKRH